MRRFLKIAGYRGANPVFEQSVPLGNMSDGMIKLLLQRLASRHLSPEEVISSSLAKNAKAYTSHLEILPISPQRFGFMTVGTDYHYTATVEKREYRGRCER